MTDIQILRGIATINFWAADMEAAKKWYTEGAYNMLQSTKPQTLTYGLNDSPVGLAAWIVEKFYA